MDALIISSIAMMLMGNSMPASGSEHHIAHFRDEVLNGRPGTAFSWNQAGGEAALYTVALYMKWQVLILIT